MRIQNIDLENLARDRIDKLVYLAHHSDRSTRYMEIAEKIAMRIDITLPSDIKRSYCKRCKTPYSEKTRIRVSRGLVTVRCSVCSDLRRI
ncbi:MAG: ribonuclease P, partial [Thermoplasmataceae archaeon]